MQQGMSAPGAPLGRLAEAGQVAHAARGPHRPGFPREAAVLWTRPLRAGQDGAWAPLGWR